MRRLQMNALLGIALAGVLAFGVACSDDDPDGDLGPLETPSVPETVLPNPPASDAEQTRDDFTDKVNNQIGQMEDRIAEIEEDSGGLSGEAKEEADQHVGELKEDVNNLRDLLTEFEGANDEDMEAIRAEIEGTLNEVQTKIESLAGGLGI